MVPWEDLLGIFSDMSFTSNKRAFLNPATQEPLLSAYCILVAIELALKDANIPAQNGGHDVPTMLQFAANAMAPTSVVSAQLSSFSAQLKTDLSAITCQGKQGSPIGVPGHNYPFIRYSRQHGDWGGVDETPIKRVFALEATCNNLRVFLVTHGATLGVQL